ncbi:MAG: phosphoserine phosphatase SerB [Pseudomonadota bacterium]
MYVVTLLCDPATPRLEHSRLDALQAHWKGGDIIWLAPGRAAEFQLSNPPIDLAEIAGQQRSEGFDLVFQPAEGRRKKMLLADMDSTMIQQECVDELAEFAGVGAQVREITARAMNGELDFEAALTERVGLLAGLPVEIIDQVYAEKISFTPGGPELIATMAAQGGYAALVSGGFTSFTRKVAAGLGFDETRANTLIDANGRLTGEVGRPILGRAAKVEALEEITARLGIAPDDVMAVGDGANDLGMLDSAGAGVALHAKPAVAAQAQIRIDHGDLTALLYIQGYSQADFVTE